MIILDATTKSLEMKLGGAVATTELKCVLSYVEIAGNEDNAFTPTNQNSTTNGSTAVTILDAPVADSVFLQLKAISILNVDTTSVTLTIQINDTADIVRSIFVVTLAVGDNLQYIDTDGFRVIDSKGRIKQIVFGGDRKVTGGTLTNAKATLFTATVPTRIDSIALVDIDATDRTFDLFVKPSGGSSIEFSQVTNAIAASDAVYVTLPINLGAGDILEGNASANSAVSWLMSYTENA